MGGSISCKVTGPKQYSADLIQGGLEIPCCLILSASRELIDKAKKLLVLCEQKTSKTKTNEAAKTMTEETNSLNNAQPAVNGNPTTKIKLEDKDNPCTSNGAARISHDQWLYHELGKVRLNIEDKRTFVNGKRLNDKHKYYFRTKCAKDPIF